MRYPVGLKQVFISIAIYSSLSTLPLASTTTNCSHDNTTIGYEEKDSLETALAESNETMFVLCPNTTFHISNLTIASDNTTLSCGSDGNVDNECIIVSIDGEPIFWIDDGVESVVMQGITFEGVNESGTVSYANSSLNANVLFQKCQWLEQNITSCYDDIIVLQTALENQKAGETFVICPQSVLNLTDSNSSLIIQKENLTIQCGDSGAVEDKCTVWGGDYQVKIIGDGALLKGLTLIGSEHVSVLLAGNGTTRIESCEFLSHDGVAVILAYNGDMSTIPGISSGQNTSLSVEHASEVILESAFFEDNHVEMGVVTILEGNLSSYGNTFYGNSGNATIYSRGFTTVEHSCFTENEATLPGEIVVTKAILVEGNYSSNEGVQNAVGGLGDCFGIFAFDTVSCLEFESAESCHISSLLPSIAPSEVFFCISDWEYLTSAINNHTNATSFAIFNICNNTEFDFLADELEPLKIASNNVMLKCIGSSCLFSGGSRHIILEGSISNITVVGITFSDVEGDDSAIYGNLSRPSLITFQDCHWARNKGRAVIELQDASYVDEPIPAEMVPDSADDIPPDDDVLSFREMEELDTETNFICKNCIFENNSVTDGILTTSGVALELSEVLFQSNSASQSIVQTGKNDDFSLSSSCFFGNSYGSVLVDSNLIHSLSERNFGASNFNPSGLQSCNGLGDIATCKTFDSEACSIDDPTPCYDDWSTLREDLQKRDDGAKNTFMLCKDTLLFADSHITIDSGNVSIICHQNDSLVDGNCTVKGNQTHFIIKGRASSRTRFQGLSFEGSESISIKAFASNNSEAVFSNCTWKDNGGASTILVYNEMDGALFSGQNIGNLSASSPKAMRTRFESCAFTSNKADFATVAVVHSDATFTSTLFDNNTVLKTGILVGLKGATISLLSSIFKENAAQGAGIILIDATSEVKEYDSETFAYNTTGCQGIFELENKSCLPDGICNGSCTSFNAAFSTISPSIISSSTTSPTIINIPPNPNNRDSLNLQKASFSALTVINIIVIILTVGSGILSCYKCQKIHNGPMAKKFSQDSALSADKSKVMVRKSSSQFTLTRIDEGDEIEEVEEGKLLATRDEDDDDSCSSFNSDHKSASKASLVESTGSQRSLESESNTRTNSRASLMSESTANSRSSRMKKKENGSESDLSFASYSNLFDEVVNDSYRSLVDQSSETQVKTKKSILKRAKRKVGKKISKIVTKDNSTKDTGTEDQPLYTDSDDDTSFS
mmetsp:Transcript_17184/g.25400  ORF Transcript_17184/g.25400 Transcript_17184/m.25400 type:complete len:1241 (+) Transcript_17184:151-3873(+)